MGAAFLIFMSVVFGLIIFDGAWMKNTMDADPETHNTPYSGAISSQARIISHNMISAHANTLKNCSLTNSQDTRTDNGCSGAQLGQLPFSGQKNVFQPTTPEIIRKNNIKTNYGMIFSYVSPGTAYSNNNPEITANYAITTFYPNMKNAVVICRQIHQYLEANTHNSRQIANVTNSGMVSIETPDADDPTGSNRNQQIQLNPNGFASIILSYVAYNNCPVLIERIDK